MFSQNHLERKTEKCALHRKAASFRKTRETEQQVITFMQIRESTCLFFPYSNLLLQYG